LLDQAIKQRKGVGNWFEENIRRVVGDGRDEGKSKRFQNKAADKKIQFSFLGSLRINT